MNEDIGHERTSRRRSFGHRRSARPGAATKRALSHACVVGLLGSANFGGPASLTPHRTVHKIEMQARIVSEQYRYSTRRFHFIKSILRHFQIAQQFRFPSEYFSIYFSA
jgi:hypothetical protein